MKIIPQEFDPALRLADLREHPDNPRRGDDKAVAESVQANGFYGAIIVQKSTGRVLAGHTRYRVARETGAETLPGIVVDVDDSTARRILLADNRTSDLAYYDDEVLFRVLGQALEEDETLLGTGYDDATYHLLLGTTTESDDGLFSGNVRQGLTPSDRNESWEASDIRSIILPYPAEQYERVVTLLGKLRKERGLDTNAALIAALLEEVGGE